jgi:hypothetical protein
MLRSRAVLAWVALASVTLVLAHEVVFLAGYGTRFGMALADSGHDARWARAVVAVLTLGALLAVAAGWRLYQLRTLARTLSEGRPRRASVTGGLTMPVLRRPVLRAWATLLASTTVTFLIQENWERLVAGQAPPGLGVLGSPEYPNSLLVILVVTLVVGVIAGLYRWHRDALVARIAAARSRWPRRNDAAPPCEPEHSRRPASILGRRQALRAPPGLLTN